MITGRKISGLPLCILLLAGAACSHRDKGHYLPYYNTPDLTPHWFSPDEDSVKLMHQVKEFGCVDQNGKRFGLEYLKNKISVVNFFFTRCGSICPKMTANLKPLADKLDKESGWQFISFSVTPWEDSVSTLKEYEKQHKLNGKNWHLLTGHTGEIYSLARQSFFAEEEAGYDKDSSEFLHTEHLILVDRNLHLRGVYNGTVALDIQRLEEDMRRLMKE